MLALSCDLPASRLQQRDHWVLSASFRERSKDQKLKSFRERSKSFRDISVVVNSIFKPRPISSFNNGCYSRQFGLQNQAEFLSTIFLAIFTLKTFQLLFIFSEVYLHSWTQANCLENQRSQPTSSYQVIHPTRQLSIPTFLTIFWHNFFSHFWHNFANFSQFFATIFSHIFDTIF